MRRVPSGTAVRRPAFLRKPTNAVSQSVKLAEELEANNVPYIHVPFEGQFHAFDFFQDTTARALYFIAKFLAEYLWSSFGGMTNAGLEAIVSSGDATPPPGSRANLRSTLKASPNFLESRIFGKLPIGILWGAIGASTKLLDGII
jgi:hypothetical protein